MASWPQVTLDGTVFVIYDFDDGNGAPVVMRHRTVHCHRVPPALGEGLLVSPAKPINTMHVTACDEPCCINALEDAS